MKIEKLILAELLYNQQFAEKVLYYLKDDFFTDPTRQQLYILIKKYYDTYYEVPGSIEVINVEIESSDYNHEQLLDLTKTLQKQEYIEDWFINKTEEWAKDRALYLALSKSIDIADGNDSTSVKTAIPEIMKEALSFTFSTKCGHDYDVDYDERFNYYKDVSIKIPSNLYYLNEITKGGVEPKTLNLVMAGTGGYKSLFLCHLASSYYSSGKNVFYFTMELAENKVAQRIDSNVLNVSDQHLIDMTYSDYSNRLKKVFTQNSLGKLIIKEYPTVGASVSNFKQFIHETGIKKNIVPDIVIVDYLNICLSSRIRGSSSGTYQVIKAIAEELRGLAGELSVPIWTATQITRSSQNSDDPELTDISESFGVAHTADLVLALVNNETLRDSGRIAVKQLKNRYGSLYNNNRFELGINPSNMKLYDVDISTEPMLKSNKIVEFADLKKEHLEQLFV